MALTLDWLSYALMETFQGSAALPATTRRPCAAIAAANASTSNHSLHRWVRQAGPGRGSAKENAGSCTEAEKGGYKLSIRGLRHSSHGH